MGVTTDAITAIAATTAGTTAMMAARGIATPSVADAIRMIAAIAAIDISRVR
jgi:hypothetical protein